MIRINSWNDMREFGFNVLTSEADGTNMGRMLVDMTPEGCNILEEFLGVRIKRGNGWNNHADDAGSVMITWDTMRDLAVFCIIRQAGKAAVKTEHDIHEVDPNYLPTVRVYMANGTAGTRNRHEFTGRIA